MTRAHPGGPGRTMLPLPFAFFVFLLAGCSGITALFAGDRVSVSVDDLAADLRTSIDETVAAYLPNYRYINLAIVSDAAIVYSASYGRDRAGAREIYASVSKPITATIVLRLLEDRTIASLDESVADYSDRFNDVLPDEYSQSTVTLRDLLTHRSGLPGQVPLIRPSTWPLLFEPGTETAYSTWGYAVIGEILEAVTGERYGELVRQHIGAPVNAESFRADDLLYDTPGGRAWSTIDDMARFAIGMVNNTYFSDEVLREEVMQTHGSDQAGEIGLGWYVSDENPDDPAIYHAGSNGAPRAFLAVKPYSGYAVCLAGRNRSSRGADDFGALAIELMELATSAHSSSLE